MMEINEKVIFEILQTNYGVMVENIVLVRRKSDRQVWKITDTKKGAYALKYLKKSNRAHKIAAVNDYLHGKGIQVTTVLSTLDGTPFVNANNGCFLLFQWLEGEQPRYAEPGMIEKMAKLLAEFHEASRGYAAAGNPISNYSLDWNQIYKRKLIKMEKFRVKASVSGDSFSKLFLSHLPWLQSRADWVLDQLPQTALSAMLDTIRYDPLLGHGDYSHINLLCSNNKKLTVIDFDTVSIALPMRDISHLITWMNHILGAWSRERLQLVLDAYRQIRPLSDEQLELLLIDQIFPEKSIRLAENYFEVSGNSTLLNEFECCIEIDKQKITDLGIVLYG